jgi:hypothetical protein
MGTIASPYHTFAALPAGAVGALMTALTTEAAAAAVVKGFEQQVQQRGQNVQHP